MSREKVIKGQQKVFQGDWLDNSQFKPWLSRVKNEKHKFRCNISQRMLELSNSGQCALKDHAKGMKHSDSLEKRNSFFKNAKVKKVTTEVGEPNSISNVNPPGQQTLEECIGGSGSTKSEIVWILNSVVCGLSARSSTNLGNAFAVMFPNSKIAKNISQGRTKYGYSINHGLGPCFKGLTIYDIKKTDVLSVSFDENLNSATQSSEMDVYVCYFDSVENEVKVRYLGSSFMSHITHEDLVKHFSAVLQPLDLEHTYHISMDGPSVNLKFHVFKDTCLDGIFHSLIDIGVCSSQFIHGAFRTGAEASGWKLKSTLKGSYKIINDTPIRREDYTSITGSVKFPYYFCGTRWVDSKRVSDQLISLWKNIIALSKFWESLPEKKRPSSKSYVNVKKAVDDDLTVSKLSFCL